MRLPWQIVEPLEANLFSEVRHAAIFNCCKWDPQVEDVCTLSPMPLVVTGEAWRELVSLAEKLAQETIAVELAILKKPRLFKELGLPWTLRRRLAAPEIICGQSRHLHLIRFDFHFTTDGWRISEANSDVPGGFNEASGFTRLMAAHYGRLSASGDPAEGIKDAVDKAIGKPGTVALVHATSFTDAFPLVNVDDIVWALHSIPEILAGLQLPAEAPPVFLLDYNRMAGGSTVNPGRFDNRWSVFPQDFPSANYVLSHGIHSIVLVQSKPVNPQRDLAHVLLRWQEAGIKILSCGLEEQTQPAPIQVARPNNFRALWYQALVLAGLRRNSAGGFGAVVPEPSSGGGGFG